jgi:hypothetical protein
VVLCRSISKAPAKWLADAVAWTQSTIAALALDGWVVRPFHNIARDSRPCGRALGSSVVDEHSWMAHFATSLHHHAMPRSLLSACYRMLKPPEPSPPPSRLVKDGELLDEEATHAEWCNALKRQWVWPNPWDATYDAFVRARVKTMMGRSWSKRGSGRLDGPGSFNKNLLLGVWKSSLICK